MKKIILSIFGLFALVACVDDYTEANPPKRLDAPALRISTTGETQKIVTIAVDRFQNTYQGYVKYSGDREFTVSVLDAPGRVNEISVVPSVPEFGAITL